MKKFAALLGFFAITIAVPQPSSACSCAPSSNLKKTFKESSVVVAAEAIEVTSKIDPKQLTMQLTTQTVTWQVHETWKGPYEPGQTFTTSTVTDAGLCGRSASKGETLLLYLGGSSPYMLSDCSRTAALKSSLKDIPLLYRLAGKRASGT